MRLLGVDFGGKRIGLAVGESEVGISSPRPNLIASGTLAKDADAIAHVLKTEEATSVVMGIPLGNEGEDGKIARVVNMLKGHLEARGISVHLVDESLSSVEANSAMYEAGLRASERRRKVDGEAACRILDRFMQSTSGVPE